MTFTVTVLNAGTFDATATPPASFVMNALFVPGPQGPTGATGPAGVVSATAPITYDSGTQTVGISATPTFTSVTATTFNATNVAFADSTTQTTAFVGEARKEYVIARNSTGSTIAKGKVVYLSGATGNRPNVSLAKADSETTSARTIGITADAIANNSDGKVIISGSVENIDTSAFNAGDTVYLSSSVAGGLQTTLPAAPLHGVVIGIVTRANASVGSIEVAINNYQELKELSDVSVSDRANNDGLFWESSSSTWRSKTIAEVLGYTPSSLALTSFSASAPISYNSGTGAFTFDSSTFLLKADNLSGLASASTARTNLGLGTMATETASNYLTTAAASSTYATIASPTFTGTVTIPAGASISGYLTTATAASTYAPLASPAFTGNPTAPTPATNDNNGSIATTAFVNAYAPAASTTVAGKVELATDEEAVAGASTALAVTPANLRAALFNGSLRRFTGLDLQSVSASGSTSTVSANGVEVATSNTTSGSYVIRGVSSSNQHPHSLGKGRGVIDWSKPTMIGTRLLRQGTIDANTASRFTLGKVFNDLAGDLTRKGIGLSIQGNGNIEVQANDGTTLSKSTTGTAGLPNTNTVNVEVMSDGAGNVTLWVNGVQTASVTGGPTGDSGSTANALCFEIQNTGTASVTSALSIGQSFIFQID